MNVNGAGWSANVIWRRVPPVQLKDADPVAEFRSGRALARDPALSMLGPDLMSNDFDVEAAVRAMLVREAA